MRRNRRPRDLHPAVPDPNFGPYDREHEEAEEVARAAQEAAELERAAAELVQREQEEFGLAPGDHQPQPSLVIGADEPSIVPPPPPVSRPKVSGPGDFLSAASDPVSGSTFDIVPRTIGERPTFSSEPWWGNRGWWKLAENGEGNDIRAHVGTVGDLALAAACLRGNKHRNRGEANQDSFAVAVSRTDEGPQFLVVAVCDGLGSSQYSAFGARLVAQATVDRLADLLAADGVSHDALIESHVKAVVLDVTNQVTGYRLGEYGSPPLPYRDVGIDSLQCTLTFAVVPCASDQFSGTRIATLGFIGDSPAFRLTANGWAPLGEHDHNDGLWSTATSAVLGAEEVQIVHEEIAAGDVLLITSDGVGNFLWFGDGPTELGEQLATAWATPVGYLEFIRDVGFELKSADDDRTALALWIKGAP